MVNLLHTGTYDSVNKDESTHLYILWGIFVFLLVNRNYDVKNNKFQ